MVNSQLFFSFDNKITLSKSDIIIGDFNKSVVDFLFLNEQWLSNIVYIYGAEGVGKSFISSIFIQENKGIVISLDDIKGLLNIEEIVVNNDFILLEDIDKKTLNDEINLFNLYNTVLSSNSKLILTAKCSVSELDIKLPDLASRLSACMILNINNPDDIALRAVFFKMLSDKQLNVSLEVIDYILKRVQRDCATLQKIILEIENFIMKEKKTLNISTLKHINLDFS